MFMSADDITTFPRCAQLLQNLQGALRADQKTFDAWLKACTADDQRNPPAVARGIALTRALPWATGPRVELVSSLLNQVDACGLTLPPFNGRLTNAVAVVSIFFVAFEFATNAADQRNSAFRLTTTVLHELVHWVRQQANATTKILDGLDLVEAGEFFEREAFGKTMGCTRDDVMDVMESIPPSKDNLASYSSK